ncbi:hypothetical protein D9757_005122 [Collybiopsis confluens]|uniref:Uncharacterized protein n=1 Tax=Collybiopsis confluens TaxID=2823264 RepID=A0A8H5MCS0_9AGAR|nr:hypothetical protein D9757_005122 [Collybiopsis confluens]
MHLKWYNWYTDYGQATVAFFSTAIGRVALLAVALSLRYRRPGHLPKTHPALADKILALFQYTVFRQYEIRLFRWYSPPLASILAVLGAKGSESDHAIRFVLRIRHGITRKLAQVANEEGAMGVCKVGPYGGVHVDLSKMDHVYLLAGGSGASFTLLLLMDLNRYSTSSSERKRVLQLGTFGVHSCGSERRLAQWLQKPFASAKVAGVSIRVHITGSQIGLGHHTMSAKDSRSDDLGHGLDENIFADGRPDILSVIRDGCKTNTGRVAVTPLLASGTMK